MGVVNRAYPWAVALAMPVLIILAYRLQILHYVECMFMILAFEFNSTLITRLQERGKAFDKRKSSYVGCCIGYKESEEDFTKCIRSYKAHATQCRAYLVALDGTVEENSAMVKAFRQEFGTAGGEIITYERPLGEIYEAFIEYFCIVEKHSVKTSKSHAFRRIYDHVKELLRPRVQEILSTPDNVLPAIMVSQPHAGMKAIRFTAFMTSMVLADLMDIEFIWSSNSDSCITPGCVENIVAALLGDNHAGAGSAALAVQRRGSSLFNRVYGGQYQNECHLRWSAGGCVGRSGNYQGPATCFRIGAVREVLIEWFMQRIGGKRVVSKFCSWRQKTKVVHAQWINEDIHMSTLILRNGWSTFYVNNAIVEYRPPSSLHAWINQTVSHQIIRD